MQKLGDSFIVIYQEKPHQHFEYNMFKGKVSIEKMQRTTIENNGPKWIIL